MEESLITFETAKLAKEKGFKIPQAKGYYNHGGIQLVLWVTSEDSKEQEDFLAFAPTQDILQKWLREECKIRVFVEQKVAGDFGFVIYVVNPVKENIAGRPWIKESHFTKHFSTYEEALEEGLQRSLNLL